MNSQGQELINRIAQNQIFGSTDSFHTDSFLAERLVETEIFIYSHIPTKSGDKNAQKGFTSQDLNMNFC